VTNWTDDVPDTWLREDLVIHSHSELWLDCREKSAPPVTYEGATSLWITGDETEVDGFTMLSFPLISWVKNVEDGILSDSVSGTSSNVGTVATHPRGGETPRFEVALSVSVVTGSCGLWLPGP
jgi:hypothetical protein